MADQMKGYVPYGMLSPGFEATYTGRTSSEPMKEADGAEGEFTDPSGNVCFKWDLHREFLDHAAELGVSLREWMESACQQGPEP